MISLLHLNKLSQFTIFFTILIFNSVFAATPVDIWKKQENQNEESKQIDSDKKIIIKSPILSDDINKIILIASLFLIKLLLVLGCNLSCIIIKLYLNSQIKTKL